MPSGPGSGTRPGTQPGQRPSQGDLGNFLGIAGGAAAGGALGGAIANRPSTLPADRPGIGERPSQLPSRPQDRENWGNWSENRGENWNDRVDNRHESWNDWHDQRQDNLNDFQNNRDDRWNEIQGNQDDRQNWRDQSREDWQQHRNEMWDYRYDRADEVWDNARDFYDDVFDDRWWGACGWGWGFGFGGYAANPWWWWRPAAWTGLGSWLWPSSPPPPAYIDHGMTVVYEGDTVYVDNQPVPAAQYTAPIVEMAANVEQPPPPAPPAEGKPAEWMTLGVFALVQEEKGDPVMFFQLAVNREGIISGGFQNELSNDAKPVAGKVDKATQRVAWRVGDNRDTIFTTALPNLTQDVCTVAIHFGQTRTQTWLLVRMPEPAPADAPAKPPQMNRTPPPVTPAAKPVPAA